MIVRDFHVVSVAFAPAEANAPLVVDADAVLPFTAALQRFEPVARRHGHVPQLCGRVQQQQFASCATLNGRREAAGQLGPEHPLGFRAGKAQNHRGILTLRVKGVKVRGGAR